MQWSEILPIYILAQYILTSAVLVATIDPTSWVDGFNILNPLTIYNMLGIKWWAAILLCVILHLVYTPHAIIYWAYKFIRKVMCK